MYHGIKPLGAIGPTNGPTALNQARALDNQAKLTGAASNYGLHGAVQADQIIETRKKSAHSLIDSKRAIGPLDALEPMASSKSSHDDEDEDHSSRATPRRRKKRRRTPPGSGL